MNRLAPIPLPVTLTGGSTLAATTTTASGTLAGSNVVALAAGSRTYLRITAPATNANSIWFALGSAATTAFPSIEIKPGGSEVWQSGFAPSNSVNINGTTGDKWIVISS